MKILNKMKKFVDPRWDFLEFILNFLVGIFGHRVNTHFSEFKEGQFLGENSTFSISKI
jgi:hypothetical protein